MPTMQHTFPFDPTYGYDEAALRAIQSPPHPEDFAAYWQATYAEAMETPLNIQQRPLVSPHPDYDLFEIEFDSLHKIRIGGWLAVPRGKFTHGMVVGHGYGGRDGPALPLPGAPAAAIFPCARGFNRSARPDLPDQSPQHVLHGIDSRDTYIHRGCAADIWAAASALLQLFPKVAENLFYNGGSFGGGIGALALPWDPRFSRAFLDVPSFGNHPLRVTLPCVGSGEAVRLLHERKPEILNVLRYFDSASAARFIRIPTLVGCALFDPAVPPPGQFSVYNNLAGPKSLFIHPANHFGYPESAEVTAQLYRRLREWFQA